MAKGFRLRHRGDEVRFSARLDDIERAVIVGLMEQVVELLDAPAPEVAGEDPFDQIVAGMGSLGMGVSVRAEDQAGWPEPGQVPAGSRSSGDRDPALQRLLPAGNRADAEVAAEFRRLTEDGLRRRKVDNLVRSMTVLREEGPIEVDDETAQALLIALTDVRLVLGERLGLREDRDVDDLERLVEELPDDDPVVHAATVYDFLTWLQETLAQALLSAPRPQ